MQVRILTRQPRGNSMGLKIEHDVAVEFERVYRDRITGFTGKCVGTVMYVSGCNQVLLAPQVKTDGSFADSQWFDDERLIDDENDKAVPRTSSRGFGKAAPTI
jgi:hypothetical protein